MSIRFACPNCRAEYAVATPPGNGMVRCKYCQTESALALAKKAEPANPAPPPTSSAPMLQESMIRKTPSAMPPPMPTRKPAAESASTAGTTPATCPVVPARSQLEERVAAPSRRKLYILAGSGAAALILIVATIFLTRGSGTPNPEPAPGPLTQRTDKDKPEKPAVTPKKVKDKTIETTPKDKPIQIPVEIPKDKKDDPPAKTTETLPAQIAQSTTQKVKQSTAYLRVTGKGGEVGEGSGFFALAPGLVVSNAHVVGMLQRKEKPKEVEIVVHSGEAQEFRRKAEVLGVDRDNDLAILRVNGDPAGLPTPLQVEFDASLAELQKVYIFGFPFGASLGKNITVSESSISSLRKGTDGLKEIQVNGGMHPGNSGGPVVDTRGVVIGVAVAVIRGTQINFAVPGARIRGLLDGRVQNTRFGEPYLADKQARLPLSVACLDPLSRIKKVRIDVWTGPPGQPRAATLKTPAALAKDGPRKSFDLTYADGHAKGEVPLPDLDAGQAYWLQPVLLNDADVPQWSTALPLQPTGPPLERVPARILLNHHGHYRTIELRCRSQLQITRGAESVTVLEALDSEAQESVHRHMAGSFVQFKLKRFSFSQDINGRKVTRHPRALALAQQDPYRFDLGWEGAIERPFRPELVGIPAAIHYEAEDTIYFLTKAYEVTTLPLPNRELKPLETWEANLPFLMELGKSRESATLQLTCIYEGTRTLDDKRHAFVRFAGPIRAGNLHLGRAEGSAWINVSAGFLAKVHTVMNLEVAQGDALSATTLDTELSRVHSFAKVNLAGARSILDTKGVLRATDPVDPKDPRRRPYKFAEVKLSVGKTYVIELKKTPGSTIDPFVRLQANRVVLAVDDGSGGESVARIVHLCLETKSYHIIITSFDPKQLGEYQLSVMELAGE